MAIDTVNKRRSVSGYTIFPVFPVADGTIDQSDREHSTWLYSGIAAESPPSPTSGILCGTVLIASMPIGSMQIAMPIGSVAIGNPSGSLSVSSVSLGSIHVTSPSGDVAECE